MLTSFQQDPKAPQVECQPDLQQSLLYDDATGLWRTTTRWYDPTLGRFTQPDTSAKETNPYLYATANPSNATDPTGEWSMGGAVGSVSATTANLVLGMAVDSTPAGMALGAGIGCTTGMLGEAVGNRINGKSTSGKDLAGSCATGAVTTVIGKGAGHALKNKILPKKIRRDELMQVAILIATTISITCSAWFATRHHAEGKGSLDTRISLGFVVVSFLLILAYYLNQ